jgi:hypothetical protein
MVASARVTVFIVLPTAAPPSRARTHCSRLRAPDISRADMLDATVGHPAMPNLSSGVSRGPFRNASRRRLAEMAQVTVTLGREPWLRLDAVMQIRPRKPTCTAILGDSIWGEFRNLALLYSNSVKRRRGQSAIRFRGGKRERSDGQDGSGSESRGLSTWRRPSKVWDESMPATRPLQTTAPLLCCAPNLRHGFRGSDIVHGAPQHV